MRSLRAYPGLLRAAAARPAPPRAARRALGTYVSGNWHISARPTPPNKRARGPGGAMAAATPRALDKKKLALKLKFEQPPRRHVVFEAGVGVEDEVNAESKFREGPQMRERRSWCQAVTTTGRGGAVAGRVLVLGGYSRESHPFCEILDPAKAVMDFREGHGGMDFRDGPNLLIGRSGCPTVAIDSHRSLIVGGIDVGATYLQDTDVLDLALLTSTEGPAMRLPRAFPACANVGGLRVLVAGGINRDAPLASTEMISFAGNEWTVEPGPEMRGPRYGATAFRMDEHRVLVCGGYNGVDNLNTTEILDLRSMEFAPGPSMSLPRAYCAAVAIDDGRFLVIGGRDTKKTKTNTTEVFSVADGKFYDGPAMRTRRSGCAAIRLDTVGGLQRIFIMGGANKNRLSTTELLDVDDIGDVGKQIGDIAEPEGDGITQKAL
ncbi:hypothetical protein M885DRAFT_544587 [Pelagophyceae sp. CCMP2097]|nr:hypothetical protein M885DRAFT_544587 [Pelagophyceae sp. CCMP2097]